MNILNIILGFILIFIGAFLINYYINYYNKKGFGGLVFKIFGVGASLIIVGIGLIFGVFEIF